MLHINKFRIPDEPSYLKLLLAIDPAIMPPSYVMNSNETTDEPLEVGTKLHSIHDNFVDGS